MEGEFPSGSGGMGCGAPAEEDYTRMPLEDRISSKAWKARVNGYEELIKSFEKSPSDASPMFKPYTRNPDAVKAIVVDSNAVAQEKGLEAVKAFLLYGGKGAGLTREAVLPAIVEKCLGAMRAGTRKLALEIVQLYAEMEDVMGCEGLIGDLLKGTAAKQPKVVAASVVAMTELFRDFGPKQASPKQVIKKLVDFFGHSDKVVRAEAGNLAKELHKWIGAALEPTISSLKDIQAKELREQFAQLDAAGEKYTSPIRYLTSQRPTQAEDGAVEGRGDDAGDRSAAAEAMEIDPLEFAEPTDPLKSKDWPENFDEMIASSKWLERKEVLAQCLKVLEGSPKIIHTMYIDTVIDVLCEKLKKDSNINVALVACQCLTRLAMGLRSDFAKNKDKALPALLEKLKEKKESTVKVVSETLDAVFQTMTLGDILEQTLNAAKHKNPAVKTGAIQFLARCLRETQQMPTKADVKPIAEALVASMADGSADVREAGAQGLGTLMKLIGERPMNQYIDSLDEIKKSKIQEQYTQAVVKVRQKSVNSAPAVAAVRPPAVTSKPLARKPPVTGRETISSSEQKIASPSTTSATASGGPPVRLAAKKAPPARAAMISSSKPAARPALAGGGGEGGGGAAKPGGKAALATEPVKYKYHSDEAEAKAADVVPAHLLEEISNSVWKDRLAGMVKFNEWLKAEVEELESELIVRFLSKKPSWKESNFQVMAEVYNSLQLLATECPTFARASIALSVTPLCEKLGDIKLKGPAGDTLTIYAEKSSFGFVLMQALTPLGNLKAPKAIADSLLWMNESILAFGTSGVDVKSVIGHLLTCLKSANAGVRTNATLVIGSLARFLGTALMTFLGDLNPQLKVTIEAEIEKATKDPAPAPTRFSQEGRARSADTIGSNGAVAGAGGSSAAADEDALDALIPRVDLDQIVPSATIAKTSDANWKERKEGLEEINALLDANTRLKSNMGEVGTALKMRYTDNNMQVRTFALDAIGKIATGMNKGFADHARNFIPPITQVLADAKAPIRLSAIKALTAIAEQVGVGPMIPGFCSVLESKVANPMLKQDLFTWLGQWFEEHTPEKGIELNGLALPAILCLDDKLAAIRKAAQSVLPFIIMRAGYKYVLEQTSSLKTASRNTVIPLIDAAKSQALAKTPKPSAAPSAAVRAAPATSTTAATPRTTSVVRNAAAAAAAAALSGSSSDAPNSQPPREMLPDLPTTTPRKGLMKPPSVVGRSLKSATPGIDSRVLTAATDATRSAAPRMSIVKRPALSSTTALVTKSAPFLSNDVKFKISREKKEGGSRGTYWIGSDAIPRPELMEVLRHQAEHHLSTPLLEMMFSKDHNAERDYLSALTVLIDYVSSPTSAAEDYDLNLEETVSRAVANSDLLFKYVAIRLTDNNTSISLKCLDLLEHLITLLREQEYHMSDYEAKAIIPCLIAKFGDPKVAFRDRIRQEIFRKLTYIYPPSKILVHYVEEGLSNKNARVRTECLCELGNLFSKNGAHQVCSLGKILPIIAQQISDRDNGVRTAALLAIGEVYKIVGEDETWRAVGKLSLKESSLLEERLRRTSAPASTRALPPLALATTAAPSNKPIPPVSQRNSVQLNTASSSPASSALSQVKKPIIASRLARPASMIGSGIQPPASSMKMGGKLLASSQIGGLSGIARPGGGVGAGVGGARSMGSLGAPSTSSPPPTSSAAITNGRGRPGTTVASNIAEKEEDGAEEEQNDEDGEGQGERAKRRGGSDMQARTSLHPQSEDDAAIEQAISEILSSDSDRSVMALKQVDQEIQNIAPSLLRHADQLTIAFGKQLHRAFSINKSMTSNDRLKKNLLFTGISIFDNTRLWEESGTQRTLGSFITKPALVSLLTELLQRLIETSGATDEETQAHGRYLNIIVLRTFSACNLNVLFGSCLTILTDATEDLEELHANGNQAILQKRVKFSELIIKCLWKITRKLNASLQDELIDPVVLLQDLERFLQVIPPNEWKRRSSAGLPLGEMPLRTIKVIITHIGSCYGEEALDLLDGVPNAETSHVYKFLLRVCDRSGGAANGLGVEEEDMASAEGSSTPLTPAMHRKQQQQSLTGSPRRSSTARSISSSSKSPNAYKSPRMESEEDTETSVNAELRNIFDRIAHKSESRAAIKDLYLFQRRNPQKEANIQRSLESTGPIFQKFIKRALANHAADDDDNASNDGSGGNRLVQRRDSTNSLAGLASPTSARSSTAFDWTATAASINRGSVMTPSSSRNSFNDFTPGKGSNFPGVFPTSPPLSSSATASPSVQRHSATDDRLAQLRLKFARTTSNQSETSLG
ncbi:hypothetical protein CBS101457_002159 [Exobasidium rhododendri]|nr:hypothetical protein CBS101457_002159 [Exobasidium rhododendri]